MIARSQTLMFRTSQGKGKVSQRLEIGKHTFHLQGSNGKLRNTIKHNFIGEYEWNGSQAPRKESVLGFIGINYARPTVNALFGRVIKHEC